MATARVIENPPTLTSASGGLQNYEVGNELRCSKCFQNEGALVCAQCSRLLCADCAVLPGFFKVAVPTVSSSESRQHEDFIFCSEHRQSYLSVGALVFVSSLLVTLVCSIAGSWLALPSAAVATLAFAKKRFVDQLIASRRKAECDVFGVFARYQFSTSENLTLDFDLGSRTYTTSNRATGKLTVSVKLDHGDKDWFMEMGGSTIFHSLHAGFYRLRGIRTLLLGRHKDQPQFATRIEGEIPSNFLDIIPAHSIGTSAEYQIAETQPEDEPPRRKLPFTVTPNEQLSAMDSRVWGLTFKTNERSTAKMTLKRLIVHVPVDLESVQSTDGVFESEQSRVVWQDIPFNSEHPASVQVEFSQPIRNVREITAHYAVEINGGGLSGLSIPANCVWYPNGRQIEPERVTVTQSAAISGAIKAATRLQANRQEIIGKKSISRPGCFLTIELAHELIAGLSKRGLYAKDIFEAPSGTVVTGSLPTICRYWEIVGRCYREHQPYDVHIVLAGQEQRAQARPANDVRLDLEVVVRSLSELQFTAVESQKVDSVALDLLSAVGEILGALS